MVDDDILRVIVNPIGPTIAYLMFEFVSELSVIELEEAQVCRYSSTY